ncbi:hypothetical protein DICPUDRAFT_44395 [Dictyostelium purpureum]|uniref:non-specific serine/threonine protein kinase n=1 Tax=Dictyostelium purpureum TaxID=5786 RepID=F1A656_DICPU|nr:uncharacterized protein DICPUDRAFT_44395 [Dictyostelium purpureum]EGC28322.1 hypothetical protein DICPUDRAFT_44395 [Dictyostelium purpureum]|eukprot:XP_003295150.1 hypothetical protein DICPUDRAFT_44395 [Dictyostelium purpureum]
MNKYIVEKNLGSGSYGETYKVKDIETNEYFCKKIVKVPQLGDIPKVLEEGRILSGMNHINVVKLYNNYFENGNFIIIMEYAENGDLWQLIEKRKREKKVFSDYEIMFFFIQLVIGLNYIHTNKIIHRDIKPKNILIKGELLLIADFGVSIIMNGRDYTNTTTGTPQYISPEICNKKGYTNKTDIWSLGVLLYELMTLSLPFEGKRETLIKNIQSECTIFKPVNHSNEDLSSLLFKLLCRDPVKRFSTQDILNQVFVREFIENHMVEFYKKYNFSIENIFKPIPTFKKVFTYVNNIDEDDSEKMFAIMEQMKDRMRITTDHFDALSKEITPSSQKPIESTPLESPSPTANKQINANINGKYDLLKKVATEIGFNLEDYCFETHGMLIELLRSKLEGKDKKKYSNCFNYLANKENLFLNPNKLPQKQ